MHFGATMGKSMQIQIIIYFFVFVTMSACGESKYVRSNQWQVLYIQNVKRFNILNYILT